MMTFAIAPSPKWYFLDATGKPAAGGFLYTYDNLDQTTPRFVYSDPAGQFPYTDPIVLDGTGGTPVPIYWDVTTPGLYYIVVTDASGNIIFAMNQFPISGSGGVSPITTINDIQNHIINGQFIFIDADSSADSLINPIPKNTFGTRIAPASGFFNNGVGGYVPSYEGILSGWIFSEQGGLGETSSIEFVDVTPIGSGNPAAPSANATRFFRYNLAVAGAPQTQVRLFQVTPNVETYSGETITVSFDFRGSVDAIGVFEVLQFYGVGGSPFTHVTQNFNFIAGEWHRTSFQINVPTVNGKIKGANNDDNIQIIWNFPLNVLGTFDLTNLQVQRGAFGTVPYIYQTYNQDQYKVLIDLMTFGNLLFPTGELKWMSNTIGSVTFSIPGWIAITDANQTLGSATSGATFPGIIYKNLYIAWWNSFAQAECIVAGGRGVSGLADFNANKTMTVPRGILGTALVGAGSSLFINAPFGFLEGTRTNTLAIGNLPAHNHGLRGSISAQAGGGAVNINGIGGIIQNTELTGSGIPVNNMQPTFYLWLYVKL